MHKLVLRLQGLASHRPPKFVKEAGARCRYIVEGRCCVLFVPITLYEPDRKYCSNMSVVPGQRAHFCKRKCLDTQTSNARAHSRSKPRIALGSHGHIPHLRSFIRISHRNVLGIVQCVSHMYAPDSKTCSEEQQLGDVSSRCSRSTGCAMRICKDAGHV